MYPYLLVNIGSGVSILKVDGEGKYTRVSGSCLGGGTFWGLCRLLTKAKSFDEMLELGMKGNNNAVCGHVGNAVIDPSERDDNGGVFSSQVCSVAMLGSKQFLHQLRVVWLLMDCMHCLLFTSHAIRAGTIWFRQPAAEIRHKICGIFMGLL